MKYAAQLLAVILFAAAVLLCVGRALPADVQGPEKIPANTLAEFAPTGKWEACLYDAGEVLDSRQYGTTLVVTGPPGQYRLRATLIDFTGKKAVQWVGRLAIGESVKPPDPQPGPEPNPGPAPQPQPKPVVEPIAPGKLWLIVVVPDLAKQTPAQSKIQASAELHNLLDSRKDKLRWIDTTTAPTELAPWVQRAQADGLPRILVAADGDGGNGKARESVALSDLPAMLSLVKKWQGVK